MIPDPATISFMVQSAMSASDARRPRSIQSAQGHLGPSDLGFCRQKTLLTLRQTPPSDSTSTWAAMLGTCIGEMAESALKEMFPTWIIGSIDKVKVSYTLPNGLTVSGTPDIMVPEWNCVLDLKTKDSFGWVKREPWSQNYAYQTFVYTAAAADMGILDKSQELHTGLVYLDRSGRDPEPYVVTRPLDPTLEDQVNAWVDDVLYALKNDEDAHRDIPAPVCEQICSFYTACRGGLPMEESDLIEDPDLIAAIELYREAMDMEKQAKAMKQEMAERLDGVNGTTGVWQIRHTDVGASFVPGFERSGYQRTDIRKARK